MLLPIARLHLVLMHAATSQTGAAARASNAKAQAIPTKIAVERSANTKRDMDSSRKI
jgi:hypothetical protein